MSKPSTITPRTYFIDHDYPTSGYYIQIFVPQPFSELAPQWFVKGRSGFLVFDQEDSLGGLWRNTPRDTDGFDTPEQALEAFDALMTARYAQK